MPKPLEDEFDAAVQLTSQQKDLPWLSNIERKAMRAGREEGRQEGRQEGSRLGLERAIVAVLCGRFGAVPPQLRDALHAIGDDGRLEDLVREAMVTPTLDGFAAKLANS